MSVKNTYQPEGNYYDKYGSKNPIVKWLMKGFFQAFTSSVNQLKNKFLTVLETGCGEGNVITFLEKSFNDNSKLYAFDISEKCIIEASKKSSRIKFWRQNIYELIPLINGNKYDLVICSEVLEHLDDVNAALHNLKKVGNYFIFSVPNEPIWRIMNMIRFKYISDFGNTPGHINHWSKDQFISLLGANGFSIIDVKSPLPWIVILCKSE